MTIHKIKSPESDDNPLFNLSESGPGYRFVKWNEYQYVVLNAELFVPLRHFVEYIRRIEKRSSFPLKDDVEIEEQVKFSSYEDYSDSLRAPDNQLEELTADQLDDVKLINDEELKETTLCLSNNTLPPLYQPPRTTFVYGIQLQQPQTFWRVSAYRQDRQIDTARLSVRPRTWLTSDLDRPFAMTGLATVGRYALPNPFPACFHYKVYAPPGTPVWFGTTRPNNLQAGGGVECFLPQGTPPHTVMLPPENVPPH